GGRKDRTILTDPREFMSSKAQEKDNNCKILIIDEKVSIEEWHKDKYGRPLDRDALSHTCNLWIRKVIEFRRMVKKKEHKTFEHYKKSRMYNDGNEIDIDCSEIKGLKKGFGLDDNGVNRTVVNKSNSYKKEIGIEDISVIANEIKKDKKIEMTNKEERKKSTKNRILESKDFESKVKRRELVKTKDMLNVGIMNVKRDKACGWYLGSTKDTNSASKFELSISLFKNRKAKLEWNLEPTEDGYQRDVDFYLINMKTKAVDMGIKNDKNKGIVMGCKIGSKKEDNKRKIVNDNRRYHVNNKKIEDLPISDREVIQMQW
ncbi:34299_t:CDS:2, partial [Gigaspora margarita]